MKKYTKFLAIALPILGGLFFVQQSYAASFWTYFPLETGDISDHSGNGRDLGTITSGGGWPASSVTPLIAGSVNAYQNSGNTNSFGNYPADQDCEAEGLNWNGTFSISLWYQAATSQNDYHLVNGRCGTKGQVSMYVDSSGQFWAWTYTGAHYLHTSGSIADGAKHFVVFACDTGTCALSFDNSVVDTDTQDMGTSATNQGVAIMSSFNGGAQQMVLDDIAFYTSELTVGEVDDLWDGGTGVTACAIATCSGGSGFPLVEWVQPFDTQSLADFYSWHINLNDPDAPTTGNLVRVYYGSTNEGVATSSYPYMDGASVAGFSNTQPFWVPKSTELWAGDNATSTTYYAYVEWYDSVDATPAHLISAQGPISFTITSKKPAENPELGEGSPWIDTTSTAALTPAVLNCTQYQFIDTSGLVPWFATTTAERVGCEVKSVASAVLQFIFVPGALGDSVGVMSDGFATFKGVVPFKTFFDTKDAIVHEVSMTGSSTESLYINFYLPGVSSSTTRIEVLTPTTFEDLFNTAARDIWYNFILTVLVILIVFGILEYIFHLY